MKISLSLFVALITTSFGPFVFANGPSPSNPVRAEQIATVDRNIARDSSSLQSAVQANDASSIGASLISLQANMHYSKSINHTRGVVTAGMDIKQACQTLRRADSRTYAYIQSLEPTCN